MWWHVFLILWCHDPLWWSRFTEDIAIRKEIKQKNGWKNEKKEKNENQRGRERNRGKRKFNEMNKVNETLNVRGKWKEKRERKEKMKTMGGKCGKIENCRNNKIQLKME